MMKAKQKVVLWLAVFFVATALIAGCGPSEGKKVADYFNAAAKIEKDVEASMDSLQSIDKQMSSQHPDFKAMLKTIEDQIALIDKKKEEFSAIPAPDSAKNLQEYELEQFDIVKDMFTKSSEMFGYIEQAYGLQAKITKGTKPKEALAIANEAKGLQKKIQTVMKEIPALQGKAREQEKKVQDEQQRLAKQYNITLK